MEQNTDHTKHLHSKIKLCVSGAAQTGHCGPGSLELAKELGKQVVEQGAAIVTGATTGFPLWAAMGAKEAGGFSIGLSPAASEREHLERYKLPIDYMDIIIYTGFGYPGRDLFLTRSSDAVLLGCGRVGTIHEFTIAFEGQKPIGILEGPWATSEVIKMIMEKGNRPSPRVIFDKDPAKLVKRVLEMVAEDRKAELRVYPNYEGFDNDCLTNGTCEPVL